MFSLKTILEALPHLVPLMGRAAAVAELVKQIVESFKDAPQDQETLKDAIADLEAENNEGHARYQAKLAEAAKQS